MLEEEKQGDQSGGDASPVETQGEMLSDSPISSLTPRHESKKLSHPSVTFNLDDNSTSPESGHTSDHLNEGDSSSIPEGYDIDRFEPKPPKVLMDNPDAVPLDLKSQIQLYATTE